MEKVFLLEDNFKDIYKNTIFDDDIQELFKLARKPREEKEFTHSDTVADSVRMFNEVDVDRESVRAVDSNYKLSGNFGNNSFNNFSGKIFGFV